MNQKVDDISRERRKFNLGASEGNRTPASTLGRSCSATKLHSPILY